MGAAEYCLELTHERSVAIRPFCVGWTQHTYDPGALILNLSFLYYRFSGFYRPCSVHPIA